MRGLEREDLFTVVFDQVLTDTALYADVVLPATTFLEHYDFARAYGPSRCSSDEPVIDAVGEARSNADVFGGSRPRGWGCFDETSRRRARGARRRARGLPETSAAR